MRSELGGNNMPRINTGLYGFCLYLCKSALICGLLFFAGHAQAQEQEEVSLQQARPVLAALAAIAEGLRPIPGKKTVVLFSQGFVTPAVLDWQVQSTIDIANRSEERRVGKECR